MPPAPGAASLAIQQQGVVQSNRTWWVGTLIRRRQQPPLQCHELWMLASHVHGKVVVGQRKLSWEESLPLNAFATLHRCAELVLKWQLVESWWEEATVWTADLTPTAQPIFLSVAERRSRWL
jgi:hypothetical protein